IAQLEATPDQLDIDREPMPDENAVAVLCPIYKRTKNIERLADSFLATTVVGEANLVFVVDQTDRECVAEVERVIATKRGPIYWVPSDRGTSCAANWNT